jgi:hypothetical protein
MFRSIGGFSGFFAILICLACQSVAGTSDTRSPAVGWELERDVENPSYAVTQPASTDLTIDSVVLSCEQGPSRRGLQLLDVLQAGRWMELRFQLVKAARGQAPAFDGIAVVDLQAGRGDAAVAAVRRCASALSAMGGTGDRLHGAAAP